MWEEEQCGIDSGEGDQLGSLPGSLGVSFSFVVAQYFSGHPCWLDPYLPLVTQSGSKDHEREYMSLSHNAGLSR